MARLAGLLMAMLLCAAGGWWLNEVSRGDRREAVSLLAAQRCEPSATAVAAAVLSAPAPAPAPSTPRRAEATACAQPNADGRDAAALLQALREGDEDARYAALLAARSENVDVPDATLVALIDADPSDRVRLLAFDAYMQTRSDSVADTRAALQAALEMPSAAVHAEARKRLADLEELERLDAASAQP